MTTTTSPILIAQTLSTGAEMLDGLTIKHSGFTSFADMLAAGGNYTPTMQTTPRTRRAADIVRAAELTILANAYDSAQAALGSDKRTFRSR